MLLPLRPKLKLNMKMGSNIKFKILQKIIIIVGLLEFPSACNVSKKKLGNIKHIEQINIGDK